MKLSELIISKLSKDDLVEIMAELLKGDPRVQETIWQQESRRLYAENKRVAGIRECRNATGWGLREAKEYCDRNFPVGTAIRDDSFDPFD
jgi:hypothetical protein